VAVPLARIHQPEAVWQISRSKEGCLAPASGSPAGPRVNPSGPQRFKPLIGQVWKPMCRDDQHPVAFSSHFRIKGTM
jgi:hypothetical protein